MLLSYIKQKSKLSRRDSHIKKKVSSGLTIKGMLTRTGNGRVSEFKSSKIVTSTTANIMKGECKESVCKYSAMEVCWLESSIMIKFKGLQHTGPVTITTLANTIKGWRKAMGSLLTVMERYIMESGKMIRDQDGLGLKRQMATNSLGNGRMIKKPVTKWKDTLKIQTNNKTARANWCLAFL